MLSPAHYKNVIDLCQSSKEVADLSGHVIQGAIDAARVFDSAGYYPVHFTIPEFIGPETYAKYGNNALWFMDSRILWTIDATREYFNVPMTVNTWKQGGQYQERGLRLSSSDTGADMSQHKFGRAIDFDLAGMTADVVRAEIKKNYKTEPAFRFITALEENVSWVHIDCRNTNMSDLLLFTK